jgi:enamine deaminase RidA (YjgF/YER057c/UK114 family)
MSRFETEGNPARQEVPDVRPNSCRVLEKQISAGHDLIVIDWQSHREFHRTVRSLPGENPTGFIRRLAGMMKDKDVNIVRHEIFGSIAAHAETLRALQHEFGSVDWPVTWVEGSGSDKGGVSGMHIFAVTGTRVDTIRQKGKVVGRVFSDGCARHCFLGNLVPSNPSISKSAQSREMFERMEQSLLEAGMAMTNVVRTWLFLDDILSWYGEFNGVRTGFFGEKKLLNGLLPASTGIGGRNPMGAAVVAGASAVQAIGDSVAVRAVPSPQQCSSLEYGSAFNRAVLIDMPAGQRLLISGTASIEPNGRSAHAGDLQKQIALTMEVTHAILASRGFNFSDVTRATAYFKNIQDAPAFDVWRQKQKVEPFPLIMAESTICRDELLFEIELDALVVRHG